MAEKQSKPLHAIVIPPPYQGHINPFLYLTLKIASKGITVTFVHLDFVHRKLSKAAGNNASHDGDDVDFFSEARELGLDIRYATIADDFPVEFDRDLNFLVYWEYMFREFPARADEFVGKMIQSDPSWAYFLIADIIHVWPAMVSDKYNLLSVAFSTEAAFVSCLEYHWDLIREKGHLPCKDKDVTIDYVPGVESISTRDLLTHLSPDSVVAEALFVSFASSRRAHFILRNTVEELEPDALSALNKHQPNYAVGPTIFYKNIPSNNVAKSFWKEVDCVSWLGSKPAGSVLYVSFGSLVETSKKVIHEVARGLLLSEVNFIWVVREGILGGSDGTGVLPTGFEDEVKDRGIIIPWCNQIRALSDRSVGGFLTHNGWNSTLESMWCGVPMICYPLAYDQLTNAKLVVDNWKIGIRLCEHGESLDSKVIADKIKGFMSAKGFRDEAVKVKEKLRNALERDGSSEKNIDRWFIDDLKEKVACHGGNK